MDPRLRGDDEKNNANTHPYPVIPKAPCPHAPLKRWR